MSLTLQEQQINMEIANNENETKIVKMQIEDFKLNQDLNEKLQRLMQNPDFKELFLDNYLDAYMKAQIFSLPQNNSNSNIREAIYLNIQACSGFRDFISGIESRGNSAQFGIDNATLRLAELEQDREALAQASIEIAKQLSNTGE